MFVFGTEKIVVYDDAEPVEKIKVYSASETQRDDVIVPRFNNEEPLNVECRDFLECIEKNKTPRSSGENGLKTVEILEAAQKSIKNNREVTLNKYNYMEEEGPYF